MPTIGFTSLLNPKSTESLSTADLISSVSLIINVLSSGFGGAQVACWPLIPKFVGSNPAEAVGFLKGDKISSARLPSEGK